MHKNLPTEVSGEQRPCEAEECDEQRSLHPHAFKPGRAAEPCVESGLIYNGQGCKLVK